MKTTWAIILLSLILILPLIPAGAQEEAAAEQANRTEGSKAVTVPQTDLKVTATAWFNKAIGFLSSIGALFGKATGFRIGGTTGTAIAALVVAKLIEDKTPSWVKWLLYAAGGTMFAGSGANITQMIMQNIPK